MTEECVWAIFVAESTTGFPNFYPVGVYTSRESSVKELDALPKDMNYQILKLPLNQLFPYYHKKSGKLVGMDNISHEHFHFRDDTEL